MTSTDFETRLAEVEGLITGRDKPRNFLAAYAKGLELTRDFPAEPSAWKQYVLAAALTNTLTDADKAWKQAIKVCPTWGEVDSGDCARDIALYYIRHRNFGEAQMYLDAAFEQHLHDSNRMAVLSMASGRRLYAMGMLEQALEAYSQARTGWKQLQKRIDAGDKSDPPNPQWQFNCDRWLLKALVRQYGSKHQEAQTLWRSLQQRMPQYGSVDLNARLKLIMKFGRLGNKLDDFIESPRGQRFVRDHPRLEKLLRRFLTKR